MDKHVDAILLGVPYLLHKGEDKAYKNRFGLGQDSGFHMVV
jgi:hypothetical protein